MKWSRQPVRQEAPCVGRLEERGCRGGILIERLWLQRREKGLECLHGWSYYVCTWLVPEVFCNLEHTNKASQDRLRHLLLWWALCLYENGSMPKPIPPSLVGLDPL